MDLFNAAAGNIAGSRDGAGMGSAYADILSPDANNIHAEVNTATADGDVAPIGSMLLTLSIFIMIMALVWIRA